MNLLFVGYLSNLNKAILKILDDQENLTIEHCTPNNLSSQVKIYQDIQPDILAADLTSFENRPVETIEYLRHLQLSPVLLVIYIYTSKILIKPLLEAGAQGYLSSSTTKHEIISAISALSDGQTYPPIRDTR